MHAMGFDRLARIQQRAKELSTMGKTDTWGAEGKKDLFLFDPTTLVIVTDLASPLYDERIHLPVSERLVRSIMAHGVKVPVIVRQNGKKEGTPNVEVVDGRQRVRATIEANKRLAEAKKPAIRVPATTERGEDKDIHSTMTLTNEIREEDSIMVRARKVKRSLDVLGKTEEEVALDYGVGEQTIRNWLKFLDLHPDVQQAVEKDGLPASTVAKELGQLPKEEQPAALAKLVESGNLRGARGVEAVKRVVNGGKATSDKVRMMSRVALEEWKKRLSKGTGTDCAIAYAVVTRILGGERALSNYPRLKGTLEVEEK